MHHFQMFTLAYRHIRHCDIENDRQPRLADHAGVRPKASATETTTEETDLSVILASPWRFIGQTFPSAVRGQPNYNES